MKSSKILLGVPLFLLCTLHATAQSGCIDSPENPTAILLVVGSAGFVASGLRAKYRARRAQRRLGMPVAEALKLQ